MRLDASKSVGEISKYTWRFRLASESGEGGGGTTVGAAADAGGEQGACSSAGSRPAPYIGNGKILRMQVLCPTIVLLTVTDRNGAKTTDETKIDIAPRHWKTPKPSWVWKGEHLVPGTGVRFTSPLSNGDVILSQNECSDGRDLDALCLPCESPHPGQEECDQNYNAAYQLAQVRHGFYEGWWYAKDRKLFIHRIGVLNPYLADHGPAPENSPRDFYAANRENTCSQTHETWLIFLPGQSQAVACRRQPVKTFIGALKAHEHYGDGQPITGHEQLYDEAVEKLNPDQFLEHDVGDDKDGLQKRNAACLKALDTLVNNYGRDELNPVKRG